MTDVEAGGAPDLQYLTRLKGGGRSYTIYVHRLVKHPSCQRQVD